MLTSHDVQECLAQAFHEVLSTEPIMIDILVMNRFAALIMEKGAGYLYNQMLALSNDNHFLEEMVANLQAQVSRK
jgi:hypothetical protein